MEIFDLFRNFLFHPERKEIWKISEIRLDCRFDTMNIINGLVKPPKISNISIL